MDFPEPVLVLLDRMDAPERSSLISDIRPAGETYGFPAGPAPLPQPSKLDTPSMFAQLEFGCLGIWNFGV